MLASRVSTWPRDSFLPQHDRAALIETHNVERVLADIDANHRDRSIAFLRHGVLLALVAPNASITRWRGRSTAGPFHYRKSRLLTDGRCHVAKYWGCKTYIALNRSRASPLVEALAVKWHHPGQRQSAAFYSMPYGISRASFHVPSGCLLTMSVAVPAHTLASPDDETVLDFHSTTTSARSSPAEMILRTSNSRC